MKNDSFQLSALWIRLMCLIMWQKKINTQKKKWEKNIVFDYWLNFLINYIKNIFRHDEGEMLTKKSNFIKQKQIYAIFYWYDVNVRS